MVMLIACVAAMTSIGVLLVLHLAVRVFLAVLEVGSEHVVRLNMLTVERTSSVLRINQTHHSFSFLHASSPAGPSYMLLSIGGGGKAEVETASFSQPVLSQRCLPVPR
jgi:hypothetical protein